MSRCEKGGCCQRLAESFRTELRKGLRGSKGRTVSKGTRRERSGSCSPSAARVLSMVALYSLMLRLTSKGRIPPKKKKKKNCGLHLEMQL